MADLKAAGKKGIFIYITAGAPDVETTLKAVREAEKAGADVIELGLPFSDPMADGPVIQSASVCALKNGMTLKKELEIVREIRKFSDIPLIGMGYINNMYTTASRSSSRTSRRPAWTASSCRMCRMRSRARCARSARRMTSIWRSSSRRARRRST